MNRSSGNSAPRSFLLGLFVHFSRRGRELDAHAGVVFEKRDFPIVLAAAAIAVHQIAELVQVFGFHKTALDAIMEFGLFVEKDLRLVADDDKVGLHHGFVIQFLAREKAVAADDAVQVHARLHELTLDDRINRIGRGGDDVAVANRLFRRIDRQPPRCRSPRSFAWRSARGSPLSDCRL